MSKAVLYDGAKKVSSISIICLIKDNEPWLQYFCKQFALVEQMYDVQFEYYFFENDSKDKSKELIQAFLQGADTRIKKNRKGCLHTDTLPDYIDRGVNFARINRLATLRNQLLRLVTPLTTDWSLLLDSNIYFDVETLGKLFECQPKTNNIGMVTPYAHEVVSGAILKKFNRVQCKDIPDTSIFGRKHYYDTFAFVDEFGHNFWPKCNFEQCQQCTEQRTEQRTEQKETIPKDRHIVDVRSAYGGFAIIETEILNDVEVRWKTVDLFGKYALCEHIAFCEAIRTRFKKRVVIDQRVDNVMWIK